MPGKLQPHPNTEYNQADIARLFNKSPQTINHHIKQGNLPLSNEVTRTVRLGDAIQYFKYDPFKACTGEIQNIPSEELANASMRKDYYIGEKARVELMVSNGELIEVDIVKHSFAQIAIFYRDSFSCLANPISARLAVCNDEQECADIIQEEVEKILKEGRELKERELKKMEPEFKEAT
jgi:hypothetical protein